MHIIETSQKIQDVMAELEKFRTRLNQFVKDKELAKATAEYDKQLAVATVEQGDVPVGIRKELAKGVVSNYKEDMIHKEITYKAILTNITVLEKTLNGWQSIFRHLEGV